MTPPSAIAVPEQRIKVPSKEITHILLVDKHQIHMTVLEEMLRTEVLKGQPARFSTTNHAWEGLDMAMTGDYSLVIAYDNLNGPDGWDLLQSVKALHGDNVKAVISSQDPNLRGLALDAGLDGYVRKPYEFSDFEQTLSPLIGQQYPIILS